MLYSGEIGALNCVLPSEKVLDVRATALGVLSKRGTSLGCGFLVSRAGRIKAEIKQYEKR